jgi:hypothetical protein
MDTKSNGGDLPREDRAGQKPNIYTGAFVVRPTKLWRLTPS